MKNLSIVIALLLSNLTLAQIEKKSDTLEVWTMFSVGNFVKQNAERIIEKEWPFKIKGVAGDAFAEKLADSVEAHNQRIWNYLDSNGYSNSKKKFLKDLIVEIKKINQAIYISNSNSTISELFEKWRKNNRNNYTELNKLSDVKYEFVLYSFDIDNLDKDQTFKLRFIVDLSKKIITIKN